MTTDNGTTVVATNGDGDADELLFNTMPIKFEVPIEMIRALKNPGAAFDLACRASGKSDKTIYMHEDLDIDPAQFSNMKTGKATLQAHKEAAFCRVVGNRIYPEWRAFQMGCTLVMIQTEAERKLAQVEQELADERMKNKVLTDAMRTPA